MHIIVVVLCDVEIPVCNGIRVVVVYFHIETVDVLGNRSVTSGVAYASEPSKDNYRENLNKLFTFAQGK